MTNSPFLPRSTFQPVRQQSRAQPVRGQEEAEEERGPDRGPESQCVFIPSSVHFWRSRGTHQRSSFLLHKASSSTAPTTSPDSDAEDEELADASPVALEFIKIQYLDFDKAFTFIQSNPSVMEEATTDGLLLEGFNAELKGQKDKAKRCVEKGLLVQYCRKLGKDGFRLFFQR